ncbi:MAG: hypothetical protein ACI841_003929, partial [Planctomycetota bacterium]
MIFDPKQVSVDSPRDMNIQKLGACCAALSILLPMAASAQSRFATSVTNFNQGAGGGIFDTNLILAGPLGGGMGSGSLDVLSLGAGGDVTLAFDVTIADGPGADFTVFENGIALGNSVFTELCFVEVSTNGIDFARFPTRYSGPAGPLDVFGTLPYGTCAGMPGQMPVMSNVMTNTINPFNPVVSGGESMDLADLANDSLVQQGLVDLDAVHYIRLLDIVEGVHQDTLGNTIWDNGGAFGSADVDAVAVIQHAGNQHPGAPMVDLFIDSLGFLHCTIADPDGLGDLDWNTLSVS